MIPEKEKAVALTTAKKNSLSKSYPKAIPLSRLIQIGGLLLLLDGKDHLNGWVRLEELIRQFYDGGIL